MKSVKYLLGLFALLLVFASCSTTQRVADEEYDPQTTQVIGNRIYVNDPYYGNVILERDPFTGRYYDVTYGARTFLGYNYPYARFNRGYGVYNRGYRTYSYPNQVQQVPHVTPQNREQARERILGRRH